MTTLEANAVRTPNLPENWPASLSSLYTDCYFAKIQGGSMRSALRIVPILVRLFQPRSVIDIGCGVGSWLAAFRQYGVTDIRGVDGDYISPDSLLISEDEFFAHDLRCPLHMERQYDLALCLEVAEHLPEQNASSFISSLVNLAPVVVFSAAVPMQGGAGHLNEQWPDYWVSIFDQKGYVPHDYVRPEVWDDEQVEWWYAQNLLCFVRGDRLSDHGTTVLNEFPAMRAVVHPRHYLRKLNELTVNQRVNQRRIAALEETIAAEVSRGASVRYALQRLRQAIIHAIRRRMSCPIVFFD